MKFKDAPKVRAICPECETVTKKETEHEAFEAVDKHNEQRHNGEDVAGVAKDDIKDLSEIHKHLRENMDSGDYINLLLMMDNDET